MIPPEVDMNSLQSQLREGDVAFATPNPANESLGRHLRSTLDSLAGQGLGNAGIVVLETTPEHPADLRDIAQDLAGATGRDTVIVRTPAASGAVSGHLTRAEVEEGQRAMMAQPDYGEGVRAFADAIQDGGPEWSLVGALLAVAIAGIAVSAYRRACASVKGVRLTFRA